ncbi:expressed protein [Phakopsora pachyrhizi]|uniref:Expressed protein n=1 Tax=Phakopsora pachyrhizi TaxID=170000 RepID=A0AAV0AI11_PHAPC|nr:expressed protein [Phakopsora pachyrhizi]
MVRLSSENSNKMLQPKKRKGKKLLAGGTEMSNENNVSPSKSSTPGEVNEKEDPKGADINEEADLKSKAEEMLINKDNQSHEENLAKLNSDKKIILKEDQASETNTPLPKADNNSIKKDLDSELIATPIQQNKNPEEGQDVKGSDLPEIVAEETPSRESEVAGEDSTKLSHDLTKIESNSKARKKRKKGKKGLNQEGDEESNQQSKKLKQDPNSENNPTGDLTRNQASNVHPTDNNSENGSRKKEKKLNDGKMSVENNRAAGLKVLQQKLPNTFGFIQSKDFDYQLLVPEIVSNAAQELLKTSDGSQITIRSLIDDVFESLRPYQVRLGLKKKNVMNLILNDSSIKLST